MASAYEVLGQLNPAATTVETLYTVPSSTSSVISTITVCNQASTAGTYRLIVQKSADAGATILAKQYIAYDVPIAANDTTALTLGITLATGDVVKAYASAATMSFQAYGSKITA
jgi:hypothetical protein